MLFHIFARTSRFALRFGSSLVIRITPVTLTSEERGGGLPGNLLTRDRNMKRKPWRPIKKKRRNSSVTRCEIGDSLNSLWT